jgi:hypothetical protein
MRFKQSSFLTLYMQNVLHYSPIQTGLAYLPLCFGVGIAAGISSQLITRIGTRPVIVAGALIAPGEPRASRRRFSVRRRLIGTDWVSVVCSAGSRLPVRDDAAAIPPRPTGGPPTRPLSADRLALAAERSIADPVAWTWAAGGGTVVGVGETAAVE